MRLATIFWVLAALAPLCARAQERVDLITRSGPRELIVVCAEGLIGGSCELARGIVELSLKHLSASVPDWRIVVIPESHWSEAADRYQIKRSTPAFSDLAIHTTYLEATLVLADGRIDENLQRYTSANGVPRLTWVMAHEFGHILCGTRDERQATAAAGRLIYGRAKTCR